MGGVFDGDFTHNMEWVTEKAMAFIEAAAETSTPFFLYFNPSVPHDPLVLDTLDNGDCKETPEGLLSSEPQVKHMTVDAATNVGEAKQGAKRRASNAISSSLVRTLFAIRFAHCSLILRYLSSVSYGS
jgi:hypothetical protein